MSGESVVDIVRSRLTTSDLAAGAQRFALAAVLGQSAFSRAADAPDEAVAVETEPSARTSLGDVWLRAITVRGFRGVGTAATLPLEPGPGLTLVVGRNGSGKSSFAEAVEVGLTGSNDRLRTKTADWRKQWRNIHDGSHAEVALDFQIDGDARHLIVRRTWTGKEIDEAVSIFERDGDEPQDLSRLGWIEALERYRPFVSYEDLGKITDKPSVVFEMLAGVLGLDAIADAQALLTSARGDLAKTIATPSDALPALLTELGTVDDDRARRVSDALSTQPLDAARARSALVELAGAASGSSARAALTRLASLPVPDAASVDDRLRELREAVEAVEQVKGTDAEEAARVASLLEAALTHHTVSGDGPCPVCMKGTLDVHWHERTTAEVGRLRQRAANATLAHRQLAGALARARELVQPCPTELSGDTLDEIDTAGAGALWREWATLSDEADPAALADGMSRMLPSFRQALTEVKTSSLERLRRLEAAWRPVAGRVQGWLDSHESAEKARPMHDDISAALAWIKAEAERLRDERLAPFRDQSARVWAELRQESNVDLGPIAFTGSQTRRKLNVPVNIDGVDGGVPMLSNGELHALALSLFLPRSTAPESPFRFVVIDDPVQAMDPAKVEGLAKVLNDAAENRQVVVFTHDDRLADALRRLMLPTTILEVVRREHSHVEITTSMDPVRRFLAEARQLAKTSRLPDDLAEIATVGMCRDAIEAASQRSARRRLLAEGLSIAEVEERLRQAATTNPRVALALLGDARRVGQLLPALNRLAGESWAADVLRDVREGVHHPRSDLDRIITDSDRLCDLILADGSP